MAQLTEEQENLLEQVFKDARSSARDFNRAQHKGRLLDEIDDDIQEIRVALDMEL